MSETLSSQQLSEVSTIELAQTGDFVALKFTGAGRQALQHLKSTIPCAPEFEAAVHEICQLAQKRGVSLLFDAEQASLQQGIDNWTLYFMKHYNRGEKAKSRSHGSAWSFEIADAVSMTSEHTCPTTKCPHSRAVARRG